MPYERKPYPNLNSKIAAAIASEAEYLAVRHLYAAILHDQMLELSPNYEIILSKLSQIGLQAREKAADARMELFDVLDDEGEMEPPTGWKPSV